MKVLIYLLSYAGMALCSLPTFDRRSMLPHYMRKKLCDLDDTLIICTMEIMRKPVAGPYSKWDICNDHPQLRICRLHPAKGAPMPTIQEPVVESTMTPQAAMRFEARTTTQSSNVWNRQRSDRFEGNLRSNTLRSDEFEAMPEFDDSVLAVNENVFGDMRV